MLGTRVGSLLWAVLFLLATGSCKKDAPAAGKPVVVASIFPVYDLVRRVAGDEVEVVLLLPPGKSEHDYQPTVAEVKRVSQARTALFVGLELDTWAARVVESAAGKVPVHWLGEGLGAPPQAEHHEDEHDHEPGDAHDDEHETHEGAHDDHHHGAVDPHVWLSVPHARKMTARIQEALTQAFPDKQGFDARAAALDAELAALDAEIRATTRAFSRKRMVTFHGAFGYFAKEYGLEIAAVIEPFPGKQPSAAYLRRVLGQIKAADVKALYTEPQLDRRPAEVLAAESGLPVKVLDPLGGLDGRESYAALMRFNVQALAESMK